MAKCKYNEYVLPRLGEIEDWVRNGATDAIVYNRLGISKTVFYEYKQKFPDFANSLTKTKEYVDAQVENALLENAMNGNITAQIFWLKNRRRHYWKDQPQIESDVNGMKNALEEIKDAFNGAIK